VPLGAVIVALILMESQVEFSTMLNDGNIERREQDVVLVVNLRDRHDK
jgi:hypothetical protein